MNIIDGVPLSQYSTMRLGGQAAHLTEIKDKHELVNALDWAKATKLPTIVIGSGSNILWRDSGFDGLVIVNKIPGFQIFEENRDNAYITIGAGENWDSAVKRTVEAGLSGIEALSLIPGTAGATPVQNVGAYGQDISQTLVSLEAYDTQYKTFVTITNKECHFGYRTSRFKTSDRNRFYITSITLLLSRRSPSPPFYGSLQTYLNKNNTKVYTPENIRKAVVSLRQAKLPDPAEIANNGSFFANPIVSRLEFIKLKATYPDIVSWETRNDKVKISAAWLIESAGLKDFHDQETGMATWSTQPLVIVNESAKSTKDVLKFRDKITNAVEQKFDIALTQEPEVFGNT